MIGMNPVLDFFIGDTRLLDRIFPLGIQEDAKTTPPKANVCSWAKPFDVVHHDAAISFTCQHAGAFLSASIVASLV